MASLCVFCGSKPGVSPRHAEAARALALQLAAANHTLVYGGGSTGIMGVVADTMLQHGGHVVGVITKHLARPELMHMQVADMRITADMHERKALMHELADGYVALSGGYGTLEELFEAVTWAQLDLHVRPVAILNIDGLYDGLFAMVRAMAQAQFLSSRCVELLSFHDNIASLTRWMSGNWPPAPTFDNDRIARS